MNSSRALEEEWAHRLGAVAWGVALVADPDPQGTFDRWLARGYHGEMDYLLRGVGPRHDLSRILPGVQSVLSLAVPYRHPPPEPGPDPLVGVVSSYAWGRDYHNLLGKRLRRLLGEVRKERPHQRWWGTIDTGPVLQRAWAVAAGLGWRGKNSSLIHRREGSFLFLLTLLSDQLLPPTPPLDEEGCGSCRLCLDSCPTGALVAPYEVDARRCLSYLTVEHKGPLPRSLRPLLGNHLLGCDVCQECCPANRSAPLSQEAELAPRPGQAFPSLVELLTLSPEDFARRFAGTPFGRPGWEGILRNTLVVLGNLHDPAAWNPLAEVLQHNPSPLLRGHAAWALGQLQHPTTNSLLARIQAREKDAFVQHEIACALAED